MSNSSEPQQRKPLEKRFVSSSKLRLFFLSKKFAYLESLEQMYVVLEGAMVVREINELLAYIPNIIAP